ncbi:putative dual-specificity RNA methyltransferase RlmN [Clostridia bacterium]|nr:putative dual-specificity RNA methyltransferase RlmN [Clostridia bacterium]
MATDKKYELKNMTLEDMKGFFVAMGEKSFRGTQVYCWLYGEGEAVQDFDEMTNLPLSLRSRLAECALLYSLTQVDVRESAIDSTRKFLFVTEDGNLIESVFMKYDYGNTICVSSQAGCKMACSFCASGASGFARNLSAAEMVDQLVLAQRYVGERISHVVVMGTGEPLDNFDELLRFVRILGEPEGLHMSRRNITVSTCGLIPGIRRLAGELPQVGLAVSLHGADDELRSSLMPINDTYRIAQLLDAVRGHIANTGRRATFEYALIKGVNDGKDCAGRLADRLKGMNCHVNLISLNSVEGSEFSGSKWQDAELFRKILEAAGIQATIRRSLGKDIQGACGQLRLNNDRF